MLMRNFQTHCREYFCKVATARALRRLRNCPTFLGIQQIAKTGGLPGCYGSACQIVQRHNPGDLFLACEDRQPANASLPHELFSLFDVLVLKAANEVGTHVMAYGRRVGVMPVSGGLDGNIAVGHHSHQPLVFANWQRANIE